MNRRQQGNQYVREVLEIYRGMGYKADHCQGKAKKAFYKHKVTGAWMTTSIQEDCLGCLDVVACNDAVMDMIQVTSDVHKERRLSAFIDSRIPDAGMVNKLVWQRIVGKKYKIYRIINKELKEYGRWEKGQLFITASNLF